MNGKIVCEYLYYLQLKQKQFQIIKFSDFAVKLQEQKLKIIEPMNEQNYVKPSLVGYIRVALQYKKPNTDEESNNSE